MTHTQCGVLCDVDGDYILLDDMIEFSTTGSKRLHAHATCKPILEKMAETKDYTILPDGPLRRGFETLEAERAS